MSKCENEYTYLLLLLRAALSDTDPMPLPQQLSWQRVLNIAKQQSVSALAYSAVLRLGTAVPSAELSQWANYNAKLLVKHFNQTYELERYERMFTEAGIAHLPLKSLWVQPLYPFPYCREMCDIDFLIPEEMAQKAHAIVIQDGYTFAEDLTTSHNTEYIKPPYMIIELHTLLVPRESAQYPYYQNAWKRAKLPDDAKNLTYTLSPEDQLIYLLVHLEKHYSLNGTGIRSFIDIYLFLKRYAEELNWAYIEDEFRTLKMLDFWLTVKQLAFYWFSDEEITPDAATEEMAYYALRGAAYGRDNGFNENRVRELMATGKTLRQAKTIYWRSIVFPKREIMCENHPLLRKAPILLPFFWVARVIRVFFCRPKEALRQRRDIWRVTVYEKPNEKE